MMLKSYSEVIMGFTGLLGAVFLSLLTSSNPIEASNGLTGFIIITSIIVAGLAEWLARATQGITRVNAYLLMFVGLVLFASTLVAIGFMVNDYEPSKNRTDELIGTIVMASCVLNITFFAMAAHLYLKTQKAG